MPSSPIELLHEALLRSSQRDAIAAIEAGASLKTIDAIGETNCVDAALSSFHQIGMMRLLIERGLERGCLFLHDDRSPARLRMEDMREVRNALLASSFNSAAATGEVLQAVVLASKPFDPALNPNRRAQNVARSATYIWARWCTDLLLTEPEHFPGAALWAKKQKINLERCWDLVGPQITADQLALLRKHCPEPEDGGWRLLVRIAETDAYPGQLEAAKFLACDLTSKSKTASPLQGDEVRKQLVHFVRGAAQAEEDQANVIIETIKATPAFLESVPFLRGRSSLAMNDHLLKRWTQELDPLALLRPECRGSTQDILENGSFVALERLLNSPFLELHETREGAPFYGFASNVAYCWPRKTLAQALLLTRDRGFDLRAPGVEGKSAYEWLEERNMTETVAAFEQQRQLKALENAARPAPQSPRVRL